MNSHQRSVATYSLLDRFGELTLDFYQLDIGEPFLLDVSDESPFMKFGSVEPGQTVPTLYNNMVRAPMFRHKASDTDFLVVRLD